MQLHLQQSAHQHLVQKVEATQIRLNSGLQNASFWLCPNRGPKPFALSDLSELTVERLEPVLADQPDILLLGTGERLRFPSAELRARILAKRVGLEVMDNAAAARTFNVLVGEHRHVQAIFLLGVLA